MALSFDDMISATIDNANNIQHACRMLLPIRTVINYIIHTLQLAVKDSLAISDRSTQIIKTSNDVACHFHKSSVAQQTLLRECNAASVPMQHVEIRWNSQLDSIARLNTLSLHITRRCERSTH